jgi:chemotaxis protein MotB
MARKKKHPEHVNHERWLISYADFITLLFAFFVVMFAVSQVDTKKLGHFTEAFSKAVGIDVFPMSGESVLAGGTSTDDEQKDTTTEEQGLIEMNGLRSTLKALSQKDALKGLQILKVGNQLVLRLPENLFFDTGDARVKETATQILKLISPELNGRANLEVRVEGHTDDRPVKSGRYRSNWELSTARAEMVMQVLVDSGLPKTRVSIAGYAEYRPVADNSTDEGRRQNRRVDLVVTAMPAPGPVPPAEGSAEAAEGKDGNEAPTAAEAQPAEEPKVAVEGKAREGAGAEPGKAAEAAKTAPAEAEEAAEQKAPRKSGEAER